ncbi:hypothetical protein [Sandarakinorhabdus sp. AAP62]|uniref:hypothetical protein n=1 Tax=Sandarakinorhabdus sp. AAP62 TaxID=1248916 RepID=UPI00030E6CE6|nr:hypothetical protein [Sandarakinorhabdus sp. AAP62]
MSVLPAPMPERTRVLLFLNGALLFVFALFVGWQWFIALLGALVAWPLIPPIEMHIPGDARAWRMVHMEAITHGLLLMAWAAGGPWLRLSPRQHRVFFWSALITAWLFTVPAWFNALAGTRGLAWNGGPFPGDITANNIIFLFGWPPLVAVHILFVLAVIGLWRTLKALPKG